MNTNNNMSPSSNNGSNTNTNNNMGAFGDTTYTKVFVGGLAWETQKETMKKYFEQFGDIFEAVVITDKSTGRSKGYGFVTFKEADAAMRACVDAAPVIDGRRANCNLASLGVQRSKPSTPNHHHHTHSHPHGGGRNVMRVMSSSSYNQGGSAGGAGAGGGAGGYAYPSAATSFPHYAIQQGIPYNLYGYSSYSPDYTYPTSYYGVYGGATAQYPMYGAGGLMTSSTAAAAAAAAFYPYLQFGGGEGSGGATTGYGAVQYPHHHHMYQYSAFNASAGAYTHHLQHYAPAMSLAPISTAMQSGVTMGVHAHVPSPIPAHR